MNATAERIRTMKTMLKALAKRAEAQEDKGFRAALDGDREQAKVLEGEARRLFKKRDELKRELIALIKASR